MTRPSDSLPHHFLTQMADLLGEEYEAFAASFTQPPVTGLRLNPSKITRELFLERFSLAFEPVDWCPEAFRLPNQGEFQAGKHPYHAAGLYYLQDPAAMAAVEILAPQPGETVLDLAAAPGGKATHLAAALGDQGFLVANEIHPRRVWTLAENLERWGAANVAITNATAERLAERLPAFFDRVLVDAPCSGEALFRRNPDAHHEWSPEAVLACAHRQEDLLRSAARLVKPGGFLLYATCTFNVSENEVVITRFLHTHTEFTLNAPPDLPGLAPGRNTWSADEQTAPDPELALEKTRRIWPHLAEGEGHFYALLQRQRTEQARHIPAINSFAERPLPKDLGTHFEQFSTSTLTDYSLPGRTHLQGTYLYCIREGCPALDGIRTIHPGLWIGVFKKNRFEPSHALAMAIKPAQVQRTCRLESSDPRLIKFLHGEPFQEPGDPGWLLVCADEFPVGWGKRVGNLVKSHFPRGLRWK